MAAHSNAFTAPCYAAHNYVPETATERLIKAALDLVERDIRFVGDTAMLSAQPHTIRELREAAFAAIEELR